MSKIDKGIEKHITVYDSNDIPYAELKGAYGHTNSYGRVAKSYL